MQDRPGVLFFQALDAGKRNFTPGHAVESTLAEICIVHVGVGSIVGSPMGVHAARAIGVRSRFCQPDDEFFDFVHC